MRTQVKRCAVVTATTVLAVTLLWSLWEWRRVSRIAADLATAENLQHDISLPPTLLSPSTTLRGTSRWVAPNKTRVILVGSSNSPRTLQSTPQWEQFLDAVGAYDLTLVTFDRADVFDRILQLTHRTGQTSEVLTISDPPAFFLTTGINTVPFTIIAAPTGKVVGLIAGAPTHALLNRVTQQLGGERRTIVGLGAGDVP